MQYVLDGRTLVTLHNLSDGERRIAAPWRADPPQELVELLLDEPSARATVQAEDGMIPPAPSGYRWFRSTRAVR